MESTWDLAAAVLCRVLGLPGMGFQVVTGDQQQDATTLSAKARKVTGSYTYTFRDQMWMLHAHLVNMLTLKVFKV